MADHLGVIIKEKDQSTTVASLAVPAGAISVYAQKGRTDEAILCRSEDDIRRNLHQPLASMELASGLIDYNRGLQNAFAFVRAGIPMYITRAIPTVTPAVKASGEIQSDGTNPITAEALGHGISYNDYAVVVAGIERITRKVTLLTGVKFSIEDNVVPRTLTITDGTNDADDTAFAKGDTNSSVVVGTTTVAVEYEDTANDDQTTLVQSDVASVSMNITYERTTTDKVVKIYIADKTETDPKNNYLESYLVSYKADGKSEAGIAIFIEDIVNDASEIIEITVDGSYDESALPFGTDPAKYGDAVEMAQFDLSGGTDGEYATGDVDIKTGFLVFDDRVKYDVVRLFDAGYADSVKTEMGAIASRRIFTHAYLDPDFSLFMETGNKAKKITEDLESQVVDDLVDWRMGLGNMEFASLTGSTWGRITDEFNGGRKLWMPPSYMTCQNAIVVHNTLGIGWSVMGPRRGVTTFEKLVTNLYNYKDELNAKQCNGMFIDERGIQMYYGNKTLKSTASAMQQSHARLTRSEISRRFFFIALDYVAEGIVPATFNDIRDDFELVLDEYEYVLESYSLVVGPPKTTGADISNQVLRIGVGLIFEEIAEEIEITTTVFKIGTDLSVAVV